jgi:hypothetical protein
MSDEPVKALTDADIMVALAQEDAELSRWKTRTYATLATHAGRRTLPVRGQEFGSWLRLKFRDAQGCSAPAGAVKAAITTLEDLASLEPEHRQKRSDERTLNLTCRLWRVRRRARAGW